MKLYESLKHLFSNSDITVDTNVVGKTEDIDASEINYMINYLQDKFETREDEYKFYDEMIKNPIIGSALELLADDMTQEDDSKGRIFWVEPTTSDNLHDLKSDKDETLEELNQFLLDIKIDEKAWSIAWNLLAYGGQFFKTYHTNIKKGFAIDDFDREIMKSRKGKILEPVERYSSVIELQRFDATVGFGVQDLEDNRFSKEKVPTNKYTILGKDDYIHFIRDLSNKIETISIQRYQLDREGNKVSNDLIDVEYKIRYGSSYLKNCILAYKLVSLYDLMLLGARLGRSTVWRLIQVEVGGATKAETAKILREIKQKLSKQQGIDLEGGSYTGYDKPVPTGQNVYIPTHNGRGAVSAQLVGGDYDVRQMLDVDLAYSLLFATLRIPKSYLGFDESAAGGIGNQSLVRLDIRYGRLVKSGKKQLTYGVQDILDYYLKATNRASLIGKYKVVTSKVVTADEEEKNEALQINISLVESINRLLQAFTPDNKKLLTSLIEKNLELTDEETALLKEYADNVKEKPEGGPMGGMGNPFGGMV